jgi:hypothetical protein
MLRLDRAKTFYVLALVSESTKSGEEGEPIRYEQKFDCLQLNTALIVDSESADAPPLWPVKLWDETLPSPTFQLATVETASIALVTNRTIKARVADVKTCIL